MNVQKDQRRTRLRFGLRTLIVGVAFVALVIVTGRSLYDWYTSTPLDLAVATFNSTAANDPVGMHEPPVTEEEIISAIRSQLPTLDAKNQVKAIYSRIARTRRLPRGSTLISTTGYSPSAGKNDTVWWINLDVMSHSSEKARERA